MINKILYISYDGILEPLGYSQVFNYILKLSENHEIILLTYEKRKDLKTKELNNLRIECKNKNIKWVYLKYHKFPKLFSTFYDLFIGFVVTFFLIIFNNIKIIHARSYAPSLIAYFFKKMMGIHFIFDMRGFWADEKIESSSWKKNSAIYKITKFYEEKFLLNADKIISLTDKGADEIRKFKFLKNKNIDISVISTCANLNLFKPNEDIKHFILNKTSPLRIGYVGSIRLWYKFDKVINFFKILLKFYPNSILHIVNKGDHFYIRNYLIKNKINPINFFIEERYQYEMPISLKLMNAGIFFLNPTYSKKASNPTKLAEFLACGIPCITNSGIGDTELILNKNNCGIIVNNFNNENLSKSIFELIKLLNNKQTVINCRKTAEKYFSLDKGVKKISYLYKELINND